MTKTTKSKKPSQKALLERALRGTGRSLTRTQALNQFGITKLSARICEMKKAGLKIKTEIDSATGLTAYSIQSRDVNNRRTRVFKN